MRLSFDNIEEVQDFVKRLKGTRGGKAGNDEGDAGNAGATNGSAPPPLAPPQGGAQTFQPGPAPGTVVQFAPPAGGAFPGASVGVDPAVQALVTRINTRIDGAIASGQPADQVLSWFRGQCGAEAANATMDQIKTMFLPKAATPTLENIAKLMNA